MRSAEDGTRTCPRCRKTEMAARRKRPIAEGHQAEVFAYGKGRVLKLFRSRREGRRAVEEARKTAWVQSAGYPAPKILGLVEVDGRQGIVMERLEGPTLSERALAEPGEAPSIATSFTDLQLRLAALPGTGLPRLEQRIAGAIQRAPLSAAQRDSARRCLQACPSGDRVFHGDFHPMNILSTARGLFVVDWFAAARAHPAADVAKTCLVIATATLAELAPEPRERLLSTRSMLLAAHLERYLSRSTVSRSDVRLWARPLAAAYLHSQHNDSTGRDLALLHAIAIGDATVA